MSKRGTLVLSSTNNEPAFHRGYVAGNWWRDKLPERLPLHTIQPLTPVFMGLHCLTVRGSFLEGFDFDQGLTLRVCERHVPLMVRCP
ncbi:MAG TPA: hypothetical protein VK581_05040, partial [Chthoniobacterales bacterium]|nr:hypothetical protein [Chthoniobacterales bacterium]